eukprot:3230889-Prorocentrum_lima.AAC.1
MVINIAGAAGPHLLVEPGNLVVHAVRVLREADGVAKLMRGRHHHFSDALRRVSSQFLDAAVDRSKVRLIGR